MAHRLTVDDKRKAAKARFIAKHPRRLRKAPEKASTPPVPSGPSVPFGVNGNDHLVWLPVQALLRHIWCLGTSGAGKSNWLQVLCRFLIHRGYGVLIIDPDGNKKGFTYELIAWLSETGKGDQLAKQDRLHLLEPNITGFVTGFNPLARPSPDVAVSVVADNVLAAIETVFGGKSTHANPSIRRVLKGLFAGLCELGLTLCEAELVIDPEDKSGLRAYMLANVEDRFARSVIERIGQLASDPRMRREFEIEALGPINRLAEFTSAPAVRNIIGQTDNILDFARIMDETGPGHVVICNLSPGDQISDANAQLLGRLLLQSVVLHGKRRKNPHIPFFVICDEAHSFLSGDVDEILSRLRGYGISLTLSHQNISQLEDVYD